METTGFQVKDFWEIKREETIDEKLSEIHKG